MKKKIKQTPQKTPQRFVFYNYLNCPIISTESKQNVQNKYNQKIKMIPLIRFFYWIKCPRLIESKIKKNISGVFDVKIKCTILYNKKNKCKKKVNTKFM